MNVRVAVFASGSGTNLQALLDRCAVDDGAHIALVISDVADAGALARARHAGARTAHVPVRDRTAAAVAHDMITLLAEERIELIALAGYLRLVPAPVIDRFRGRIINVHPALLPAFGGPGMYGRHVHDAVIAAGCTVTGATVHWVDERYDGGAIIAQWPVPVLPDDDAARLAARVLSVEHRLYPAALAAVARHMRATVSPATAPPDTYRLVDSLDGVDREIAAILRL
ncbi:MAG TPA: phosphoribosylglycinamide formyltransferase [Longimicrobiales bacterium]|nr:phosphoribosylglycinamide formyltransferase [Longimicrobiales bacterium]